MTKEIKITVVKQEDIEQWDDESQSSACASARERT